MIMIIIIMIVMISRLQGPGRHPVGPRGAEWAEAYIYIYMYIYIYIFIHSLNMYT